MLRVNDAVEALSRQDSRLGYFDIASPMLGEDGKPRDELFAFDGLHLNLEGYRVWSEVIFPGLQGSGCYRDSS
jgi:lysophospholipase L1-like esterase